MGVTPGMRRPVRTMTLPSIPSRSMRFGETDGPNFRRSYRRCFETKSGFLHGRSGLEHHAVVGPLAILQ